MAKIRLPDKVLESDEFEFIAPEDEFHDLRKRIHIVTGTILDVEHRAPEWSHHGAAVQQRVGCGETRSTITKQQGIFRTAIGSLFSAPQIEAQEQYLGYLREAPAQGRALPAPSNYAPALALPAPRLVTSMVPASPVIADQREVPMMSSADRVAAAFRRKG